MKTLDIHLCLLLFKLLDLFLIQTNLTTMIQRIYHDLHNLIFLDMSLKTEKCMH